MNIIAMRNPLDVTKGKVYEVKHTCSEEGVMIIDDVGDPHWLYDDSWEGVADDHEQETFGPLSNDPLINPKKAAGAVKAPLHATPTLAKIHMGNVMAGGAYKYGFMNFRESEIDCQTYIGAIERHFLKWQDGVDLDEESQQHELAHVMACCAIVIDAHFTGKLIDNRSKTGLVEGMLKTSEETFGAYIAELSKS